MGIPKGIAKGIPMGITKGIPMEIPKGIPMGIPKGIPKGIPMGQTHVIRKTKKTRSARTIIFAAVSRRDLCYASENK